MPFFNTGSGTPASLASAYSFNKWKLSSVDLSVFMNQDIRMDVIASDCTQGGHFGYGYFDAQCGFKINFNGRSCNANSKTTELLSCGTTMTLIAPLGLAATHWEGPGLNTSLNSFTTNSAGTFTLSYSNEPNCGLSTVKYFRISRYRPVAVSIDSVICKGSKTTLGVAGNQNFRWSTGDTVANIVVSPTITTTYTVSSLNDGCQGTNTVQVRVQDCLDLATPFGNTIIFKLYPNPNSGIFLLEVQGLTNSSTLLVENILGQKISTQSLSSGENKINLENSPSGIYTCSVIEYNRVVYRTKMHIK